MEKIDWIFASEELILKKVKRVDVTYKDGVVKSFDPYDWVILREGIIKNLYLKGLCEIRFRNG